MQIFTSYYGKLKELNKTKNDNYYITISRFIANWIKENTDEHILELSPSKKLLNKYKYSKKSEYIKENYYIKTFEKELEKVNLKQILDNIINNAKKKNKKYIYFLCYEKPTDFCHRHIIAKKFNEIIKQHKYNIPLIKEKFYEDYDFSKKYKYQIETTKLNLAVVGTRTFNDYRKMEHILNRLIQSLIEKNIIKNKEDIKIISGGATGADSLARKYAKLNNIEIKEILPEWSKYGKSAGFKRNIKIWKEANLGIGFWDGKSKGTEHSIKIAKDMNKDFIMYIYTNKEFKLYDNNGNIINKIKKEKPNNEVNFEYN